MNQSTPLLHLDDSPACINCSWPIKFETAGRARHGDLSLRKSETAPPLVTYLQPVAASMSEKARRSASVKAYATPARTHRRHASTCARGQVSHKP
jgi:hypothetical protein